MRTFGGTVFFTGNLFEMFHQFEIVFGDIDRFGKIGKFIKDTAGLIKRYIWALAAS